MNDYSPIDCGLHSQLELAIMHRRKLRLKWRPPEAVPHDDMIIPVDLITRDQAEFLVGVLAGNPIEVRLDWIIDFFIVD